MYFRNSPGVVVVTDCCSISALALRVAAQDRWPSRPRVRRWPEHTMMRRFRLCQHTKDDGALCGSPAMRRRSYCYFHLEVVRRRRQLARMARTQRLLAEAKRYDDRILALNSYGMNLLGHYSRATPEARSICEERWGEGPIHPAQKANLHAASAELAAALALAGRFFIRRKNSSNVIREM